jgi:hypothetical protein
VENTEKSSSLKKNKHVQDQEYARHYSEKKYKQEVDYCKNFMKAQVAGEKTPNK